jgi:tryptophan halogenase
MKSIKNIAVIGGGTAGFISALILKKRFPHLQIDLIHSKKIGIVGVGEGSTQHWLEFMNFMGINHHTIITECDATYKSGIMFKDWVQNEYLHSVNTPWCYQASQYSHIYARQISKNLSSKEMSSGRFWRNKVNMKYLHTPKESPVEQYHFNTYKLNNFLNKLSIQNQINIIDDEIIDVKIKEDGDIGIISGVKQNYEYDFYIDCTGFKRLLISKLGAKWKSFGKHLKMKAAIAFPTEDTDEYNMWTLAKAMDYGWLFRIPVWGRGGNGYIYDSDYISSEQAKIEVESYFGKEIDIGKEFKFNPGTLEQVWINNCCAIGLSANFVEPMEATSIATTIQQSFLLMHRIINYDNKTIDRYNKSVMDIMENIRDFIALHYIVDKKSSEFWKNPAEIPDSLLNNLELWKHRMPIKEDFSHLSDFILFTVPNFILVMHGLNLFNVDSIKSEYEQQASYIKEDADWQIKYQKYIMKTTGEMSHKNLLQLIRETSKIHSQMDIING